MRRGTKENLIAEGGSIVCVGRGVGWTMMGTEVGFDFNNSAGKEP